MRGVRRLAGLVALAPALACVPAMAAGAALWGYVDVEGVAHFADRAVDSRYQLVLGDAPGPAAVPGKSDGARGMLTWLQIAPQVKAVQPWLREAARRHGVDIELLKAVIAVESGFDAKAVSPRGAIGLMQITTETAQRYALGREADVPAEQRLLDPRTNILTGARALADLVHRLGRIDLALAAWNAGEGAVRRHGGQLPPIAETRAHVHLTLELYWALLQHSQAQRARSLRLQP